MGTRRDTFTAAEDLVSIGVVAAMHGVTVGTIRNWERAGKIRATRTLGGHRRYLRSEVEQLLQPSSREQEVS